VDAKIRNVIGDLFGKSDLSGKEKQQQQPKEKKQHIKKKNNTTHILQQLRTKETKNLKEEKTPFENEKSKREKPK